MYRAQWRVVLFALLCLTLGLASAAEMTPAVTRGLGWLAGQVQADGHLRESPTTLATPLQGAAETARVLRQGGQPSAALVDRIAAGEEPDTEYIARRIAVLSGEGRGVADLVLLLAARQRPDGGFAPLPDHESNPLDTAFALNALAGAGHQAPLPAAVAYLVRSQAANGAYGVGTGRASVYVTALASAALQRVQATEALTQVTRANAWLRTMQKPDGGWGTVLDTSMAKLALAGTDPDAALSAMMAASIGAGQGEDGSWSGDPYLTAIALRALMAGPAPPPAALTGNIRGRLLNAVTSAPIAGATVALQPASTPAVVSNAAGEFAFDGVAPGSYALVVTAAGFDSGTLPLQVRAGMTSDAGPVALQASVTSGSLGGIVTDRATGAPLTGALVSIDGASTGSIYSAVDGSYLFPNLVPGAVTVRVSKAGYVAAGASATIAAGTRVLYSPALQAVATTAVVSGKVADSETGMPLGGVMVRVAGLSTLSDAGGRFTLAGIPAGAARVELVTEGYVLQSFAVLVEAGMSVDVQTIPMYKTTPPATTGTVSGTVSSADGKPLAGVTITVQGSASLHATTGADGSFMLANVTPGALTLGAARDGYVAVRASATLTAGSTVVFSPKLELSATPRVSGRVLDKGTLAPIVGATVLLDKEADTTDSDGRFSFSGVVSGNHLVTVDAAGYVSRVLPLPTDGRNAADMGGIELASSSAPLTVTGRVTDQANGQGIARALITVLGAELSAVADADGRYRLDGVLPGAVTTRFSAPGYTGETVILDVSPYNLQPLDHALRAGRDSSLALEVTLDRPSYPAYTPLALAARVTNSGDAATTGTLSLTVLDAHGNYVDGVAATRADGSGQQQSRLSFAPGENSIALAWNTAALPPGSYTAAVRIHQVDGSADGGPVALAQKELGFAIEPTSAIASVRVTPLPGYSHLGARETLGYRVDVVNRSNVPVSSRLAYQLAGPDAALVDSGEFVLELAPAEATRSIMLAGRSYQFAASGSYVARLLPLSGLAPAALAGGAISVAPATRVTPTQTVSPATVVPVGDPRIHVELRLIGVQQK